MKINFQTAERLMKRMIKAAVATVLYRSGLLWLLLARRLRNRTVVLMYHRVLPEADTSASPSTPGIIVNAGTFERHMACLRRRFTVLDPEAFVETLESDAELPSRSVVVTLDDGWRDNYVHAGPILKKYEIPALIFLTSGFVETDRMFWQEGMVQALLELRQACRMDPSVADALTAASALPGLRPCLVEDAVLARAAIDEVVAYWKARSSGDRGEFMRRIGQCFDAVEKPDRAADHFLHWREVLEMQQETVRFGSHGVNHSILTDPETDVAQELGESKAVLEERLGRPVDMLAYPNGDYDDTVVQYARRAGYRAAFTTRRGLVNGNDDRWKLNRCNIHEGAAGSIPLFLMRILGIW